jgi:hypothetical protein
MRRATTALACLALAVGGLAPSTAAQARSAAPPPTPPPDSSFQKVTLNDSPGEPMALAVLPDLRVLHTTRPGRVWLHDPRTGLNTVAADIPVYSHDEEGLQGIAIDPDLAATTGSTFTTRRRWTRRPTTRRRRMSTRATRRSRAPRPTSQGSAGSCGCPGSS